MSSAVKSSPPTSHILPLARMPDGAALAGATSAAGLGETLVWATAAFCSLEAGDVCGDSAGAAAPVDSLPPEGNADAGCSGCAPVADADSFDAEMEVCAAVPVPAVSSPAPGVFIADPKASPSLFEVALWLFAAKTLSGIGLGSTAGLPSAWAVSNAGVGMVAAAGLCIQPTSYKAAAKTPFSADE